MARTQKKYILVYIEMSNRWITFVKKWAAKKGLSYGCALSQPQLKIDYRKAYPTKQQESFRQGVERGSMEEEDIHGQSVREQEKELAYQTRERPRLGIFKDPRMLQYAIASKRSKLMKKQPKAVEQPRVVEQPEIVEQPKAKKGQVLIKVLDDGGLRILFKKNYDAGGDNLLPPFPKAPNGFLYNEEDFYTLINSASMSTSSFKDYAPLAKFLQKKGLLEIIKYKAS